MCIISAGSVKKSENINEEPTIRTKKTTKRMTHQNLPYAIVDPSVAALNTVFLHLIPQPPTSFESWSFSHPIFSVLSQGRAFLRQFQGHLSWFLRWHPAWCCPSPCGGKLIPSCLAFERYAAVILNRHATPSGKEHCVTQVTNSKQIINNKRNTSKRNNICNTIMFAYITSPLLHFHRMDDIHNLCSHSRPASLVSAPETSPQQTSKQSSFNFRRQETWYL